MPVPKRATVRRNRGIPSTPDTVLPRQGRRGAPPKPPVPLGTVGKDLWRRLWASPQATTWQRSHDDGVAKRSHHEHLWFEAAPSERVRLAAQVQAWEDRWGFNPRALAQMHMAIEGDEDKTPAPMSGVTDIRDRLKDAAG